MNLEKHSHKIITILAIFYTVGIILIFIPQFSKYIIALTPAVLLGSYSLVAMYHNGQKHLKPVIVFLIIAVAGFIIELIGVEYGFIFGHYTYGENLGIKLFETPLLIGLNWLFLVYTTHIIVSKIKLHPIIQIFIAAGLMVIYDLVLEQIAPNLHMWSWKNDSIPFQNYLAWFGISAVFHTITKLSKLKFSNRIAVAVLICQFLFFMILLIVKQFIDL